MEEKIKEAKLAIIDRIITNITDKDKGLDVGTIVALSGIIETFDKTEIEKHRPSFEEKLYEQLIKQNELQRNSVEMPKVDAL